MEVLGGGAFPFFPPSSGVDALGGNLGSGQRVSTSSSVAAACGAAQLYLLA